jgi:hypothetical protein
MDIHVHAQKKLIDIQHEFQTRFPFLKLEFYSHTHRHGEMSPNSDLINLQQNISALDQANDSFEWHINSNMSVSDVETTFQEKFKIGVHVFRKSGLNWLQTTTTDSWTLAEQNARGKEMSEELPKEEPEDYHEQE